MLSHRSNDPTAGYRIAGDSQSHAFGPPGTVSYGVGRRWLKKWLRLPVRQTEAYLPQLPGWGPHGPPWPRACAHPPLEPGTAARRNGILVLDHSLPMPDRDAGSRTVFEHIVTLLELGYEIHFWAADGIDVPGYARPLRGMGVHVVAGYFRPSLKRWLGNRSQQFDYVLLNRPEVADSLLDVLRDTGLPIIYYGHDLHFAECIWRRMLLATWPEHGRPTR